MIIGIVKETAEFEARVAATPETVKKYKDLGFEIQVEADAGKGAFFLDESYKEAGASIVADAKQIFQSADILLKVAKPSEEELGLLKSGAIYISLLNSFSNKPLIEQMAAKNVSVFAMEMVPRISRAQKLDALSSQSNIAGYKSVLLSADKNGKFFPMMMTAAGTIQPAKVLVIGAGVAGLQAIATAKRLGAVVEAFDTRPVVKEQVESLGGKFVELETEESTEDAGGYAKEVSEDTHKKELALIAEHAIKADVVITTALIPGKPAPVLIEEETVKAMKPGAVIVDLAAEMGGNCTLAEANQEVIKHDVLIIGHTNLPSMMAHESSQLYARNVLNLIVEIYKDEKFDFDFEDEIVKGACVAHGGKVIHPMLVKS